MMNSVVQNGTGRRAQLDGIPVAGKTGTTNGWRDAWFVGYTGNFVGAVWMGNDDYTSTKRMTGGTIPALIWHNIMAYAHQGIELRPLPGLPPPQHAPTVADAALRRRAAATADPAHAQGNRSSDPRRAVARRCEPRAGRPAPPAATLGALDDGGASRQTPSRRQANLSLPERPAATESRRFE